MARHSAVPEPRGERRRREDEKEALRSVRGRAEATPGSLDRLIHERMRLGIVSALAANETLTFNELKALLQTTDGNLSVHARKLEEAGYISCTKSFDAHSLYWRKYSLFASPL